MLSILKRTALLLPVLLVSANGSGVYLHLASSNAGTYDAVTANVRAAAQTAGWSILADYEAGVNRQKCSYRAHVFIADWPEYTRAVSSAGVRGAFAAQVRLAVFEDEKGVHVAAVNPRSLNRTVVAETGRDQEFNTLAGSIEQTIHGKLPGKTAEFGQLRERGRIGRTMGIMAGGPFEDKIEMVVSVPLNGSTVSALAARLYSGLEKQAKTGDWKIRPVFHQTLSNDIAVIGVSSESIEAKSFDIVSSGGDDTRSKFRCPGIDHAAAYPIEVVVSKSGDNANVQLIDEMYRMKLYFEDAGKMAFMKNMGMPGSIEDEIRNKIHGALR